MPSAILPQSCRFKAEPEPKAFCVRIYLSMQCFGKLTTVVEASACGCQAPSSCCIQAQTCCGPCILVQ